MSPPLVIAIADARWSDEDLARKAQAVLRAVPTGSLALQLRDKARDGKAIAALAERLQAICSQQGAPFYLNDRVDVALAVGADGVHLGGASIEPADARALLGQDAFLSVAAHDLGEVDRARLGGANAVLASPIFATPGKGAPRGTEFLAEVGEHAGGMGVYALGGVDLGNAAACCRAGAHGVALIRALWDSPDPAAMARALVALVRGHRV